MASSNGFSTCTHRKRDSKEREEIRYSSKGFVYKLSAVMFTHRKQLFGVKFWLSLFLCLFYLVHWFVFWKNEEWERGREIRREKGRERRENRRSGEREEGRNGTRDKGGKTSHTLAYQPSMIQHKCNSNLQKAAPASLHSKTLDYAHCTFLFFLCFRLGLQSCLSLFALPLLQL